MSGSTVNLPMRTRSHVESSSNGNQVDGSRQVELKLRCMRIGNDVYIFPSVLGPKWDLGLIQFDLEGTGADGALVLLASIACQHPCIFVG